MVILTLIDARHQRPLRQWHFEQEPLIRIGRARDNHVVLPDPLVSRHHLELRWIERPTRTTRASGWQLLNCSSNGTFLNGLLVSRSKLPTAGVLQLAQGGPSLQFQITLAAERGLKLPFLPSGDLPNAACQHFGNPPENLFCVHCGQPLKIEQRIRQYQVLRVLGRGGMGTTYLAWNPNAAAIAPQAQPLVVLKEMTDEMARIQKAQELFEREALTLKALNHPGIPKFYDFFMEAGKKYLVMELIHGQNLEQLAQQGLPSRPAAIAWMIQTCQVLAYLHTLPIPLIHRDIKPSNLMLRSLTQQIAVLDFGAVKPKNLSSMTRIGAEGYSAPEQIQGKPVIQSDLYAIGACLIYLLTGDSPQRYCRKTRQGYRLLLEDCTVIDPPLRAVIERATELNPGDRYPTARALAQALQACLGSSQN
jgi:serine/threonine-protein kinase